MTTTRTRTSAGSALCVVMINHAVELAMPVEKGLALVKLLSGVMEVRRDFSHPSRIQFSACERRMQAELVTISADQIIVRTAREESAKYVVETLPRRLK